MSTKKMMIYKMSEEEYDMQGDEHICIPSDLVERLVKDTSLSQGAKLLCISVASEQSTYSHWTDAFFAEKLHISMSTVQRYKKELREAGYIN